MNNENNGVLYILGTPIGNLGDISARALETLKNVDFIAAEDTRVTGKLLMHFGIKKPLVSCHEHNIAQKSGEIIKRLQNGESLALVTDAGMPCISDPGEPLIKEAVSAEIKIEVVPGPTAFVSALAISGLPSARFSFEGFLSVTKKQRKAHLESIKDYPNTLIFYEAPHKLKNTLGDFLITLGDRKIALCRELTKIHEEVIRGNISDMIEYYKEKSPRGEYVLIIEGKKVDSDKAKEKISLEKAGKIAENLIAEGYKRSEACKITAEQTGLKKSEIYSYISTSRYNYGEEK